MKKAETKQISVKEVKCLPKSVAEGIRQILLGTGYQLDGGSYFEYEGNTFYCVSINFFPAATIAERFPRMLKKLISDDTSTLILNGVEV